MRFSSCLVLHLKSLALCPVRISSRLCKPEGLSISLYLEASWIDSGPGTWSDKQYSLSDGASYGGSLSKGLLAHKGHLASQHSLFCWCWKSPIPAVPAQCHRLAGLWLEVLVLMGNRKHFIIPFLPPVTTKVFFASKLYGSCEGCYLLHPLLGHFLYPWLSHKRLTGLNHYWD